MNEAPLKVAFVIDDLGDGGAERALTVLSKALTARGLAIEIYGVSAKEKPPAYVVDERVSYAHLSCEDGGGGFVMLRRIKTLRAKLKKSNPDVAVGFMSHNSIKTVIACFGLGIPVVFRMAAEPRWEARSPLVRLGMILCFPLAKGAVYQNPAQYEYFRRRKNRRDAVIMNPVEENPLWAEEKTYKNSKVLTAGRLTAVKNHSLLLRAWSNVAGRFPEWSLDILGEGENRKALEREKAELGIDKSVYIPGFSSDVMERFFDAPVFALTSDAEGLPNALLEAMCLGMACVTTNFDGDAAGMLIDDGVNGLIVPKGNEEALAAALSRLMEDETLRAKLGQNAAELRQRVNADAVALEWIEFLTSIADGANRKKGSGKRRSG